MTKPRPLPDRAAHLNEDTIAVLLDIQAMLRKLDELVARGRTEEARHLIDLIFRRSRKAQELQQKMRGGDHYLEENEIDRMRGMWGEDGGA